MYLVGKYPTSRRNSKLSKTCNVLGRFLAQSENTSVLEAAELTAQGVKAVWQHHFGPQLVMGKKAAMEPESEKVKLIIADHHIAGQESNLFKK